MRKLTLLMVVLLLVATGLVPALAQEDEESDGNAVGFNVLAADIEASNGVVHVIDTVLVPPNLDIGGEEEPMDEAEATEEASDEEMTDEEDAEATEEASDDEDALPTIAEIVATSPDHTVLLAAVTEAGLVDALSGEGPFTVFAPTDAAFEAALEALGISAEDLLADTELLTEILGFHVIPGAALMAADLAELDSYETLSGVTVQLGVGEDAVSAGMGDSMDMEEEMAEATEEPMDEEMTDEAEDAEETADEEAAADEPGTIVEVAVAAGDFTTLVAAVEAADLVETLSGEGPFTVFAPTDEAFAAALEALDMTAEELLADTDLLTSVLTYHVVAGEFPASAVAELDGEDVETVNGATVNISAAGDSVKVNDANVTAVDVMASNGVIHVIDAVLLPPADEEEE